MPLEQLAWPSFYDAAQFANLSSESSVVACYLVFVKPCFAQQVEVGAMAAPCVLCVGYLFLALPTSSPILRSTPRRRWSLLYSEMLEPKLLQLQWQLVHQAKLSQCNHRFSVTNSFCHLHPPRCLQPLSSPALAAPPTNNSFSKLQRLLCFWQCHTKTWGQLGLV